MREVFLQYAKSGPMTKAELAKVLKTSERSIADKVRAGKIPVVPLVRPYVFDPMEMIEVFCKPLRLKEPRSLTIERHKTRGKLIGGYLECL